MCQLSIVNLGKRDLNIIIDYLLSFESSTAHSDGFGVMYGGRFDKTVNAPKKILDFSSFVGSIVTSNNMIFSHIRQASHGVDVCEENSHPFESENFLLMHNGTLTKEGEDRSYKKGQKSDSLIFLEALEEEFKKTKDFVSAFNNTMKTFWGKFAFLIFQKKKKLYYICRGYSADLYVAYLLDDTGNPTTNFVVNTDKANLERALLMISNISQVIYKKIMVFSDPVLLDANSIFLVDKSITKIGDTKENIETDFKKELVSVTNSIRRAIDYVYPATAASSVVVNNSSNKISSDDIFVKIMLYMLENLLSPKDIVLLYKITKGTDIFASSETELFDFYNEILKKIKVQGGIATLKFMRKSFKTGIVPSSLYTTYKLEFPWMINKQQDIVNAVHSLQRDMKRERVM